MLRRFLGLAGSPNRAIVDALYEQIVAAARRPVLYAEWQVPDTPLGRYEMISLHVFLFLRRLRGVTGNAAEIAQEVTDEFFKDVEHSLREFGIGDMGVPKRMKKLARMYYGRVAAYDSALEAHDRAALAAALARNVRPGGEVWAEAAELAEYVLAADAALALQPLDVLMAGPRGISRAGRRTGWRGSGMSGGEPKSPVAFEVSVQRLPRKGMPVEFEADADQRLALA